MERLADLQAKVAAPDAPLWWDRPAIETLFGLRRRQAIALLQKLGARRIGTGLAVERERVRAFLADPRRRRLWREEQDRTAHLARHLAVAQERERKISWSQPVRPTRIDFAGLPAGIELERHRLTIAFDEPAELLEKLFALGKALLNDFDSFEKRMRA
jgi:hypothetical protein